MSKFLRHVPIVLTLLLLGMWLLLNGELSVAQVVLGVLLSMGLVLAIAQLRPVRPRMQRLHLAVPLAARVFVDILKSNLHVAAIVLRQRRDRPIRSGFLEIPIDLTDPHGLAILAIIVTSTPGTSWAGLSSDGRILTLHVLDLDDGEVLIRSIKQQYEQRLLRIFE